MTITPEEVARLAAEASPGPWFVHDFSPLSDVPSATDVTVSCSHPDSIAVAAMLGGLWGQKSVEQAIKDAAFIAAAHDMAALIAEQEAKLAKAMTALVEVREFVKDLEPYAEQGHTLVPTLQKACAVYAELTGKNT